MRMEVRNYMLSEIKKNIKILLLNFKYNMAREMENRGSFISQVVFMILNNSFAIVQWFIFFSFKNTIGGYKFNDILMLWALASASYGIAHLFFENVFFIPQLIADGKLDAYISQPLNILWNVSVSKTNPSAFGDLIYGIILAFIAVGTSFYKIPLFILFALLGGITMATFAALAGCLTFWLKRGEEIAHSFHTNVIMASTYPEGIFNVFVKIVLYTVIPVGFMIYMPLQIISNLNLIYFVAVLLFDVLLMLLTFYVFNKGLKKYSSSNLMNARV